MEKTYKTSQIRYVLKTNFDDVGLESLCQDEFPALCNHFGSGMGKDQMINCIVGHFLYCRAFSKRPKFFPSDSRHKKPSSQCF